MLGTALILRASGQPPGALMVTLLFVGTLGGAYPLGWIGWLLLYRPDGTCRVPLPREDT